MDRFKNMETFTRVVESNGISAAADRLGVVKSVISRRLSELEGHLGVELFHRTTRRINLTDIGKDFYKLATRILEDVREAELKTSQSHATLKGPLKIALPSTFGLMHVSSAITEFSKLHPQVEFELDFNDREVDLIQEGFDLAIRIAHLPDSSLIARRLAPIRTTMCASPSYLKKMGTPQSLSELKNHKCLVYSLYRDFQHWDLTNRRGKTIKTKIQPILRANTGEFLNQAAIEGLGIIITPTFITYKDIEDGKLIPILPEYSLPQLNAYAIYPQTHHLSQRMKTFVSFLIERFKGGPYWDDFFKTIRINDES